MTPREVEFLLDFREKATPKGGDRSAPRLDRETSERLLQIFDAAPDVIVIE